MKGLIYLILLLGTISSMLSCEKEAKNPGDFNLKAELKVTAISAKSGSVFDVNVIRSIDSTYRYYYTEKDTLKDSSGEYILSEEGKLQITDDTIYYNSKKTAKFIELEKITLEPNIDTIHISLESNAKWLAPMPGSGDRAQWFFTQNLAGGGDGTIVAAVTRNRNFTRPVDAIQYIHTSDSMVMYKVTFGQKGERD